LFSGSDASFVATGDFNGDGITDLAVTNFNDGTVSILFGLSPALADLQISETHTPFNLQTGGTWTLVVTNAGVAATQGTVTLSESLASGQTATAIGGSGWTCSLGTLRCTRTDAPPPNGAYPPVTISVSLSGQPTSVAITAFVNALNSIQVSATGNASVYTNPVTVSLTGISVDQNAAIGSAFAQVLLGRKVRLQATVAPGNRRWFRDLL
jgi:hypothetical protein